LTCKQQSSSYFHHIFITDKISERCAVSLQIRETTYHFPLYTYLENNEQQSINNLIERRPNLNPIIIKQIASNLELTFTLEKEPESEVCFANSAELRPEYRQSFAPIDLLDYIYAVLHSPTYREKYKEFLKIDFPRVPYPKDAIIFWQLVKLGGELRQIHLLESPVVEKFHYPISY
jgi:predicted helicase